MKDHPQPMEHKSPQHQIADCGTVSDWRPPTHSHILETVLLLPPSKNGKRKISIQSQQYNIALQLQSIINQFLQQGAMDSTKAYTKDKIKGTIGS